MCVHIYYKYTIYIIQYIVTPVHFNHDCLIEMLSAKSIFNIKANTIILFKLYKYVFVLPSVSIHSSLFLPIHSVFKASINIRISIVI